MAIQVIHTGGEAFKDVRFGTNLSGVLGNVFEFKGKLDEAYYKIKKEEEAWALKMMDVKTSDLVYEKVQEEARELLDGYVSEITKRYQSNEILSQDDKMAIAKMRSDVEGKINTWRNKLQQYLEKKKLVSMHPNYFDLEETQKAFDTFEKDPVNKDIPEPVPAYVDYVAELVKMLNISNKLYTIQEGDKYKVYRIGAENDDGKMSALLSLVRSNEQVKRSIAKAMGRSDISEDKMVDYLMEYHQEVLFPDAKGIKPASSRGGQSGSKIVPLSSSDKSFLAGVSFENKPYPVSLHDRSFLREKLKQGDVMPQDARISKIAVDENGISITFSGFDVIGKTQAATALAMPNAPGERNTSSDESGMLNISTKAETTIRVNYEDTNIDEVANIIKTLRDAYGDNEVYMSMFNKFMSKYESTQSLRVRQNKIDYKTIKK